jgi:hypothetical protein
VEAATAGAPAAAEADGQVQETGQEQEAQQVDVNEWQSSVDARLGDALDGIRQMAEVVQTRLPEPAAEEAPDFDAQFAELFEQSGGFPDPTQLQGLIQDQIASGIKQAVAPFQQQFEAVQQKMTAQELGALQGKFPELGDAKVADGLANEVVTRAEQWGVPQLANSAEFVEMVHRDMQSRQRAQQETPAGQGSIPQIETGGGAAPASSGGDEWDAIVNAGRKGPVW